MTKQKANVRCTEVTGSKPTRRSQGNKKLRKDFNKIKNFFLWQHNIALLSDDTCTTICYLRQLYSFRNHQSYQTHNGGLQRGLRQVAFWVRFCSRQWWTRQRIMSHSERRQQAEEKLERWRCVLVKRIMQISRRKTVWAHVHELTKTTRCGWREQRWWKEVMIDDVMRRNGESKLEWKRWRSLTYEDVCVTKGEGLQESKKTSHAL